MSRMLLKWLLCLCMAMTWAHEAHAQNCVLNIGNMSFGTLSGAAGADATSSFVLDCNVATGNPLLRVCISIGAPGFGDVRDRKMSGPASAQLAYNLYSDSARTQIWGSILGALPPPPLDYPISGGKVHASIPLYGRVASGQGTLPGGSYSASYAPTDVLVGIRDYSVTPSSCASILPNPSISQSQLYINANLAADCTVSATLIDFGQRGALNTDTDATGTVTASCGGGIAYSLSMNAGTGVGATLANRVMTRSGGTETLRYNLYSNTGRTSVWGDGSAGTATVSGSGNGSNQTYTVYARMPAQAPVPRPGSYKDSITLTITY